MSAPETDPALAPSYLAGKVAVPDRDGPAAALWEGGWCGHGEERYRVWDVPSPGGGWRVETPIVEDEEDDDFVQQGATIVKLGADGATLLAYDTRRHPSSPLFGTDELGETLAVECDCGSNSFDVAVGFEVPEDSGGPDETSWFAIAVRCRSCRERAIVFDDETA